MDAVHVLDQKVVPITLTLSLLSLRSSSSLARSDFCGERVDESEERTRTRRNENG